MAETRKERETNQRKEERQGKEVELWRPERIAKQEEEKDTHEIAQQSFQAHWIPSSC